MFLINIMCVVVRLSQVTYSRVDKTERAVGVWGAASDDCASRAKFEDPRESWEEYVTSNQATAASNPRAARPPSQHQRQRAYRQSSSTNSSFAVASESAWECDHNTADLSSSTDESFAASSGRAGRAAQSVRAAGRLPSASSAGTASSLPKGNSAADNSSSSHGRRRLPVGTVLGEEENLISLSDAGNNISMFQNDPAGYSGGAVVGAGTVGGGVAGMDPYSVGSSLNPAISGNRNSKVGLATQQAASTHKLRSGSARFGRVTGENIYTNDDGGDVLANARGGVVSGRAYGDDRGGGWNASLSPDMSRGEGVYLADEVRANGTWRMRIVSSNDGILLILLPKCPRLSR